jgi:hypothetical protein
MSVTGTVDNRRGPEVKQVEGRPSRYHTKARTRHDRSSASAGQRAKGGERVRVTQGGMPYWLP